MAAINDALTLTHFTIGVRCIVVCCCVVHNALHSLAMGVFLGTWVKIATRKFDEENFSVTVKESFQSKENSHLIMTSHILPLRCMCARVHRNACLYVWISISAFTFLTCLVWFSFYYCFHAGLHANCSNTASTQHQGTKEWHAAYLYSYV